MQPAPVASGLIVCERVIVEAGTNRASLIGDFVVFEAVAFPFMPQPFYASAVLTGSQGTGQAVLTLIDLETEERLDTLSSPVTLFDRFDEVRIVFLLRRWVFPEAGDYLVNLEVDGEWVAHRRIYVRHRETEP